jgi:hypothetical protein
MPTTKTLAPLPALPDLAGFERYRKALDRQQQLKAELAQARADLTAAKAELARLRPPKKVELIGFDAVVKQPPPVRVAAEAIAAGADVPTATALPTRSAVQVAADRVDECQFRVWATEDAVDLYERRELRAAREAAQAHYGPAAFADVWQPAMRAAARAWLEAAVHLHRVDRLRRDLGAAGLWGFPMSTERGLPYDVWGDPADPFSDAARIIDGLVEAGHLDADDPLLAGLYTPPTPTPSQPATAPAGNRKVRAG